MGADIENCKEFKIEVNKFFLPMEIFYRILNFSINPNFRCI